MYFLSLEGAVGETKRRSALGNFVDAGDADADAGLAWPRLARPHATALESHEKVHRNTDYSVCERMLRTLLQYSTIHHLWGRPMDQARPVHD